MFGLATRITLRYDVRMRVRASALVALHRQAPFAQARGYGARHGNLHLIVAGDGAEVAARLRDVDTLVTRWSGRGDASPEAFVGELGAEAGHPTVGPHVPAQLTAFLDALADARQGLGTRSVVSGVAEVRALLGQLAREVELSSEPGPRRSGGAATLGEGHLREKWKLIGPDPRGGWMTLDPNGNVARWTPDGKLVRRGPAPWRGEACAKEVNNAGLVVVTDAEVYLVVDGAARRWPRSELPIDEVIRAIPLGDGWWAAESPEGWFLLHDLFVVQKVAPGEHLCPLTEGCVVVRHEAGSSHGLSVLAVGGVRVLAAEAEGCAVESDGRVVAIHTPSGWEFHPLDGGAVFRPALGCAKAGTYYRGAHGGAIDERDQLAVGRGGRWIFDTDPTHGGVATAAYAGGGWTLDTLARAEPRAVGRLRHAAVTVDAYWMTTRRDDGLRTMVWSESGVSVVLPMQQLMSMVFGFDPHHVLLGDPAGTRVLARAEGWLRLPSDPVLPVIACTSPQGTFVVYRHGDNSRSTRFIGEARLRRAQWRRWPVASAANDGHVLARAHGVTWAARAGSVFRRGWDGTLALGEEARFASHTWDDRAVTQGGDILLSLRTRTARSKVGLLVEGDTVHAVEGPDGSFYALTRRGVCMVWRDAVWQVGSDGAAVKVADVEDAWSVAPRGAGESDGLMFTGAIPEVAEPVQQALFVPGRVPLRGSALHWWHRGGEQRWSMEGVPRAEHMHATEVAGGVVVWSGDGDFGGAWWCPFDSETVRPLVRRRRVGGCVATGQGFVVHTRTQLLRFGAGAVPRAVRVVQSACVGRFGPHAWVAWDGWGEAWIEGTSRGRVWCGEDVPPTELVGDAGGWLASWSDDHAVQVTVGDGTVGPAQGSVIREARVRHLRVAPLVLEPPRELRPSRREFPPKGSAAAPALVDAFRRSLEQVLWGAFALPAVLREHATAATSLAEKAAEIQAAHITARRDRRHDVDRAPSSHDASLLVAWARVRAFGAKGKRGPEHLTGLRAAADSCLVPRANLSLDSVQREVEAVRTTVSDEAECARIDAALAAMEALRAAHAALFERDGGRTGPLALFWWLAAGGRELPTFVVSDGVRALLDHPSTSTPSTTTMFVVKDAVMVQGGLGLWSANAQLDALDAFGREFELVPPAELVAERTGVRASLDSVAEGVELRVHLNRQDFTLWRRDNFAAVAQTVVVRHNAERKVVYLAEEEYGGRSSSKPARTRRAPCGHTRGDVVHIALALKDSTLCPHDTIVFTVGGIPVIPPEQEQADDESAREDAPRGVEEIVVLDGNSGGQERLNDAHYLRRLSLRDCRNFTDLSVVARLVKLEQLDLQGCRNLKNHFILQELKGLREVDLSDTNVHDLTPLAGHASLAILRLERCGGVTSLAPLRASLALTTVVANGCASLIDVGTGFPRLASIEVRDCTRLPSLDAFVSLPALTTLDISGCPQFSDLRPLSRAPALERLTIRRNRALTSVAALAACPGLTALDLSDSGNVRDLDALAGCASLRELRWTEDAAPHAVLAATAVLRGDAVSVKASVDAWLESLPLSKSPDLFGLRLVRAFALGNGAGWAADALARLATTLRACAHNEDGSTVVSAATWSAWAGAILALDEAEMRAALDAALTSLQPAREIETLLTPLLTTLSDMGTVASRSRMQGPAWLVPYIREVLAPIASEAAHARRAAPAAAVFFAGFGMDDEVRDWLDRGTVAHAPHWRDDVVLALLGREAGAGDLPAARRWWSTLATPEGRDKGRAALARAFASRLPEAAAAELEDIGDDALRGRVARELGTEPALLGTPAGLYALVMALEHDADALGRILVSLVDSHPKSLLVAALARDLAPSTTAAPEPLGDGAAAVATRLRALDPDDLTAKFALELVRELHALVTR